MDIQAVTRIHVLIRLDEEEARNILVDPRSFQSDLRQALAKANGHEDLAAVVGHAPAALPQAARTRHPGKFVCPKCRSLVANRIKQKHLASCRGAVPAE